MKDDPLDRFREGLEDFLEVQREDAMLSPHTLEAYRRDVTSFLIWATKRKKWATRSKKGGWKDLEEDDIVDYLESLRGAGAAEASRARALSALRRALLHQVTERGLEFKRDPVARIKAPILSQRLPAVLTVEEVEALVAVPQGNAWQAQRDRALLEVLATGARVSEVVELKQDKLHLAVGEIYVSTKGARGKERRVYIGKPARESLDAWLKGGRQTVLERALKRADRRPRPTEVFLTRSGRPMTRKDVARRVDCAARSAGLLRNSRGAITPHTLRHSFATNMIKAGVDPRVLQKMLGHKSISSTERYTRLEEEHIVSLHHLYHPRG